MSQKKLPAHCFNLFSTYSIARFSLPAPDWAATQGSSIIVKTSTSSLDLSELTVPEEPILQTGIHCTLGPRG